MRTRQEIDARSRELHRLVAAKVRREPALLDRVRPTLQRWRDPDNPSRADPYLAEWERLMADGPERLLALRRHPLANGEVLLPEGSGRPSCCARNSSTSVLETFCRRNSRR
jgi:hypothetical protein